MFKDGNMWCCLSGLNVQEGYCGFSKLKAVAFLKMIVCFIKKHRKGF